MTIFQALTIGVVLYLSIGLYAALATSLMVTAGLCWDESTAWQKFQRSVMFPVETLWYRVRPPATGRLIGQTVPSYNNLQFLKKNPTVFCLLFWPIPVAVFLVCVVVLSVSFVASPLCK